MTNTSFPNPPLTCLVKSSLRPSGDQRGLESQPLVSCAVVFPSALTTRIPLLQPLKAIRLPSGDQSSSQHSFTPGLRSRRSPVPSGLIRYIPPPLANASVRPVGDHSWQHPAASRR